jgi:hypothetical protein
MLRGYQNYYVVAWLCTGRAQPLDMPATDCFCTWSYLTHGYNPKLSVVCGIQVAQLMASSVKGTMGPAGWGQQLEAQPLLSHTWRSRSKRQERFCLLLM